MSNKELNELIRDTESVYGYEPERDENDPSYFDPMGDERMWEPIRIPSPQPQTNPAWMDQSVIEWFVVDELTTES